MKSRSETLVLAAVMVACLLVGGALAPKLLGGTDANHHKGDPTDVNGQVPRAALLEAGSLERGASPARFTLVEFADYECPSCGRAEIAVRDLLSRRKDLRLVFRNFPMVTSHPHAQLAAQAAEVANKMGKGWQMHDALFDGQTIWSRADDVPGALAEVAETVGLDRKGFAAALDGSARGEVIRRIQADQKAGVACSVDTTPSFFLMTPTRTWAAVGPVGLDRLLSDSKYWQ